MGMLLYPIAEKLQTLRGIAAPSGRKSLRKLNANDKRKKKPTWRNTLRYSTTSAYSLTGLPAGRVTLYLVIRRLSFNYSAGPAFNFATTPLTLSAYSTAQAGERKRVRSKKKIRGIINVGAAE
jgi:hypothetical protein